MPKLFPEWWNPNRKHRRTLAHKGIYNTRDLIIAAHSLQTHVQVCADDPVSIAIEELYAFCNTHLHGLVLHLKSARAEAGVVVTGRRPNTMISHIPSKLEPAANPPPPIKEETTIDSTVSMSTADEFTTDCYGWTQEDIDRYPNEVLCPITTELFEDPVVAADGHTYERSAIVAWLAKKNTSPMTNEPLATKMIFDNIAMRKTVERLTA